MYSSYIAQVLNCKNLTRDTKSKTEDVSVMLINDVKLNPF